MPGGDESMRLQKICLDMFQGWDRLPPIVLMRRNYAQSDLLCRLFVVDDRIHGCESRRGRRAG
jgi:hypothetical protein